MLWGKQPSKDPLIMQMSVIVWENLSSQSICPDEEC